MMEASSAVAGQEFEEGDVELLQLQSEREPQNRQSFRPSNSVRISVAPSLFVSKAVSIIAVALFVDVVVLMSYIFVEKPPVHFPATQSGTTMNTYNIPRLAWKELPSSDRRLERIAFGSCASQNMPQPYWDTLVSSEPDLVLLMGDNVYGDCDDSSCSALKEAYREFARHPSVIGAAPKLSVMATLDDHDYGMDNADETNVHRDLGRELFGEVFNQENMPSDGVYNSKVFGRKDRVQVIMLDTRYSRSVLLRNESKPFAQFYPMGENTLPQSMLSENQWSWLAAQLEELVDVRLIVSSIQVLNSVTGEEAWRHLPREKTRLLDLLDRASGTSILLSGDRHVGGFYQYDNHVEITASSWTHTVALDSARGCNGTTVDCDEDDPRLLGPWIRENHFGIVEIDWKQRVVAVSLRRAESTNGIVYRDPKRVWNKLSDAGEILDKRSYPMVSR